MFLFKPSQQDALGPYRGKRVSKSLAALYRILREDFDQRRSGDCSCKMPMIFEAERGGPHEPNWRVEKLWCGSIACQDALAACISHHAKLYELAAPEKSFPRSDAISNF